MHYQPLRLHELLASMINLESYGLGWVHGSIYPSSRNRPDHIPHHDVVAMEEIINEILRQAMRLSSMELWWSAGMMRVVATMISSTNFCLLRTCFRINSDAALHHQLNDTKILTISPPMLTSVSRVLSKARRKMEPGQNTRHSSVQDKVKSYQSIL